MGRSRYHVLGNQPHFLTCTIVNWIPLFGQVELAQIVIDSLNFLHRHQRLTIYSFVIMENHLHLIASSANLSKEIGDFKSFTARSIIDLLKKKNSIYILNQLEFYKVKHKKNQEYQLWQEGFHPQAILNEEMFRQKLDYIHNNPIKRGYVDDPAHWRYSSYRNYMEQPSLVQVELIDFSLEAEPPEGIPSRRLGTR
ncbi:REP-associated tyrosine transposase [Iningainema tapete]|uniref:Transposase n=1 Tax=Iningainema tapete BLCC-T55 TaxID=2748662 RepID=A0A8J6XZR8_9CYAN|nr:transposase [Iningainema tapete]MBD2776293.1 transposase [Iningainema tapete BLCC-T55]